MNSLERIQAVLDHRLPDRVPLAELHISPVLVEAIVPGGSYVDLVDHLDMDMVAAYSMIYEDQDVDWIDRGQGIFRDKWGARQQYTEEAVPVPIPPAPIETPEDLRSYTPPNPADSHALPRIRELKERYPNGEKAICFVGESGWAPAIYLRGGMEHMLIDVALRPEFIKEVMRIGAEYYRELVRLAVEAGADVVLLGDDYSDKNGPMVSPKDFEEIVLPCDADVVASAKKAGAHCIKHTDGDIRKIMDMLVSTDLDALGPLEPVPGMEMDAVLERYPGRIAVMGNMSIDLLVRGTEEQIVEATKDLLRTVSSAGPHILSSANTIVSAVKPENFLAMLRTAKEYGQYPIDPGKI